MRQHPDTPDTPGAHQDHGFYLLHGDPEKNMPDLFGTWSAHSNTCECRIVLGHRQDNGEVATGMLPCEEHEHMGDQISDALRVEIEKDERGDDLVIDTMVEVLADFMVMANSKEMA